MSASTVNIAFTGGLLKEIDRVAEEECRTRSELIREASRMYVARKGKWETIFESGARAAKEKRLQPRHVLSEIRAYRKSSR